MAEFLKPIEFDPDEPVGVRLYDQHEQFARIPAIALIDFANQLDRKTLSLAATAAITGLTFGSGALSGGGVLALEGEVAAGEASAAALWGARIVLWADRVSAVLPVVTELADENRDWILEKVPGGEILLDALDEANAIAAYYGWARLGFDGLRFLKGKMSAALNARQAGGVPTDLSSTEKELLGQIDRETASTLQFLDEGEEALTKDAVNYVEKHPETIKGEPGKRSAEVGEGHKIEEVADPAEPTGIGCELHSPGGRKIWCPEPMGTPARANAEAEGAEAKAGKVSDRPAPAKRKAEPEQVASPPSKTAKAPSVTTMTIEAGNVEYELTGDLDKLSNAGNKAQVYVIRDSSGTIRYVGSANIQLVKRTRALRDAVDRLKEHLRDLKRSGEIIGSASQLEIVGLVDTERLALSLEEDLIQGIEKENPGQLLNEEKFPFSGGRYSRFKGKQPDPIDVKQAHNTSIKIDIKMKVGSSSMGGKPATKPKGPTTKK